MVMKIGKDLSQFLSWLLKNDKEQNTCIKISDHQTKLFIYFLKIQKQNFGYYRFSIALLLNKNYFTQTDVKILTFCN